MVAEEEGVSKETVADDSTTAYWATRYTLRPPHVPSFLAREQGRVLTTGKYLNVLRECGRDIRCPDADGPEAALLGGASGSGSGGGLGEAAFSQVVSRAFFFASSTLLTALRAEFRLVDRLRSMKHYFLLDQGDLYVNFMDLAEDELKQPLPKVDVLRVGVTSSLTRSLSLSLSL
jgi:gamma-tubulin complex component 2